MKKFKNIFFFASLIAVFASCESDEEKYSGTPVGNQTIETIQAEISVDPALTSFLTNQKIPFTIDLKRTFKDSVVVEVSSLNLGGGRTRVYVDVVPNQQIATDEIPAAGGAIFNTTMELYISAIELKHTEPGKHYLIESNRITLQTGNTAVPSDNDNRLQVKFAWLDPSNTRNNFRVFVDRPNAASYVSAMGASNTSSGTGATGTYAVFVASTAGLEPGMAVNVSSGKGLLLANTTVTAVINGQEFRISQPPTAANALDATSVITAGGNDFTLTNATSGTGADANLVNLDGVGTNNTTGLQPGMTVTVVDGTTGRFRGGTTITQILGPNQFKVSLAPNLQGGILLNGATIKISYPDVIPLNNGQVLHDITNSNEGQVSLGTSTLEGEYNFRFLPISVLQSGADIPYRIVWKYPNGTAGFYDGVFSAATVNGPSIPVLKVTKTGSGLTVNYEVAPEGL